MRVESAQARPAGARGADAAGDWPTYNRDLAGTRYSPLTQINTTNVSTLAQAWSYRLRPEPGVSVPAIDKPASSFELFQQVTPIVVNGVMYLPSGHRVVALEPETGKEIWRYELPEGLASFRGVAYWPGDGPLPPRIFFTSLRKLIALRADTGALDTAFGNGGHIDLGDPVRRRAGDLPERRADGIQLLRARRAAHRPAPHDEQGGEGRRARLRRAHGQEGVGLPHHSAARRSRPRHVGQRQLEGSHRQQRLVVHADRGRAARPRLHAGQRSGHELLRRRPARRQPVQQRDRGPRRADGQAEVALPEHPPRNLGLQPPARARPDRHQEGRPDDSRARAGREIRLHVHPEPRERHAGPRRRGTSAGQGRRARRVVSGDATDSQEARSARQGEHDEERSRHGGGHDAGARGGVPRVVGQDAVPQRRAVHAVELPAQTAARRRSSFRA